MSNSKAPGAVGNKFDSPGWRGRVDREIMLRFDRHKDEDLYDSYDSVICWVLG